MVLDAPSSLAQQLEAGKLDLAMIPSIEYLRHADSYNLLPGLSISSRGPVGTVLMATQVPLGKIHTIALDNRSRTSATLLRLLFSKEFPKDIQYLQAPPDPRQMLENNDAALIIGDQALGLKSFNKELIQYDLSEEWFKLTGKTFVHAVVAYSSDMEIDQNIIEIIQKSKSEGLANLDEISREQAEKLGMEAEVCKNYLDKKILYSLGNEEMDGLLHFQDLCRAQGLL